VQHSVWNWDKVQYDYYTSNTPNSVGGWRPLTGLGVPARSRVRGRNDVGVDIEAVLPPLPRGARWIGVGPQAVGQICRRPAGAPAAGLGGLGGVSEYVLGGMDALCSCDAKAKIDELNTLANRNRALRDRLMMASATVGPDAVTAATQAEARRVDAVRLRDWIYGVQAWAYRIGVPRCEQWMERDIDCGGQPRVRAARPAQGPAPRVGVAPVIAAQVTLSVGTIALTAAVLVAITAFIVSATSDTAASEAAADSLAAATHVYSQTCASDPSSQACRDALAAVERARQAVLEADLAKQKNSIPAVIKTVAITAGIGGLAYLAYRYAARR